MAGQLSFDPLVALVASLNAAGVRANLDPANLNLPGAWVTVEQIAPLTLAGNLELAAVVYLINPDTDYARAYPALASLYNLVATVLTPDGPVVPQGVVMPGDPTPLPALRVPVNLT